MQFVHRIFCEYLTAKEVMDEHEMGLMLDNAEKQHWHNVVVMAGAYARPGEANAILRKLIQRGQDMPEHRDTLYLLAAAILEQLTLPNLPEPDGQRSRRSRRRDIPTTTSSSDLVKDALAELIPPKTLQAAEQLGKAGPFVLDLLPSPDAPPAGGLALSDDKAARVVRTIAVVAALWDADAALDKILPFTARRSAIIMAQLLEPWGRYGDYAAYARTVLAEINFRDVQVDLQGADRVQHIGYIRTITDLVLRNDIGDLSPLTQLPELRRLRLERNSLVNLGSLVGCRALRTLHLSHCSSMAEARSIDLRPLAELQLDELILSRLIWRACLTLPFSALPSRESGWSRSLAG
jgi:hypothetical protein